MLFIWIIISGKSLEKLDQLYRAAKSKYDSGGTAFEEIRAVLSHCTNKLNLEAKLDHFGKFSGNPSVDYSVASSLRQARVFSNIRKLNFLIDCNEFIKLSFFRNISAKYRP